MKPEPSPMFTDVDRQDDPHPTWTFRTGLVAYQESLIGGQLVGRGWNGAGFMAPESQRIDTGQHAEPQAFTLEVDGQSLRAHWSLVSEEVVPVETGIEFVMSLTHAHRPVSVKVHTQLDGTCFMKRWLEVTNDSEAAVPLSAASSWSGVFQSITERTFGEPGPYRLGYFQDSHWGNCGDFGWQEMPYAGYRIDGYFRRDRHRHPMFILNNRETGENLIGSLAFSGGYSFEFDLDDGPARGTSRMSFKAGPAGPAPLRVLDPGETIVTPTLHLGLVIGDLDDCVNALHDHTRRSVFRPLMSGKSGLITSGIGPEMEVTEEAVMHEIEMAAQMGVELFILDASWYAEPYGDWFATAGDWEVNRRRFPKGIEYFVESAHERGLLFGLWMEPERLGTASQIRKEHPEWVAHRYDDTPYETGLLDLTNPEAVAWVEANISRLIETYGLDCFRLDYNVGFLEAAGYSERHGWQENRYWRQCENLYGLFDRLTQRFPDVIFQNCASGGARTDLGFLRYFDHTWVTDHQIAPRSFSITSGMSMALPPERMDRLIGYGQYCGRTADIDFQGRLALFTHATMGWYHLIGAKPNLTQQRHVERFVKLYKEVARPMHGQSRIYHHTPTHDGLEPSGWGALELAHRDRSCSMAGVFRLQDPAEPVYHMRFKGVDPGARYAVRFDNEDTEGVMDGYHLKYVGIPVRLDSPLTSQLFVAEAVT